jgi:hypothetical protein
MRTNAHTESTVTLKIAKKDKKVTAASKHVRSRDLNNKPRHNSQHHVHRPTILRRLDQ